jgi:hypothetical protein
VKWHYGGTSAAPLFSEVMRDVLNYQMRQDKLGIQKENTGHVR